MLLVFRKNPRKWNYGWSSVLKTCTALIVGIFERICFNETFLMARTSTEQLFIERPMKDLYIDVPCIMITYLISSNLCKKRSLQWYLLYNFPPFRSIQWRCSIRKGVLRNFAKFTGKHLWQSQFFNKVAGWGDCFWSFSYLLLKISCLFHFNRKTRWKKRNTLMGFKYLLFFSSIDLFVLFVSWLVTYQWKKIIENCNSVGAGAQNIGKVVSFWPNFDPNFTDIWRA